MGVSKVISTLKFVYYGAKNIFFVKNVYDTPFLQLAKVIVNAECCGKMLGNSNWLVVIIEFIYISAFSAYSPSNGFRFQWVL